MSLGISTALGMVQSSMSRKVPSRAQFVIVVVARDAEIILISTVASSEMTLMSIGVYRRRCSHLATCSRYLSIGGSNGR
jgi:hypothetical protein